MSPSGKTALSFDVHFSSSMLTFKGDDRLFCQELPGELQKSRETGVELGTMNGAMGEVCDMLAGGLVRRFILDLIPLPHPLAFPLRLSFVPRSPPVSFVTSSIRPLRRTCVSAPVVSSFNFHLFPMLVELETNTAFLPLAHQHTAISLRLVID